MESSLTPLLSSTRLASERDRFPACKDLLPDMVLVMQDVVRKKCDNPALFTRRGSSEEEENRCVEEDHAVILDILKARMEGTTFRGKLGVFLRDFMNKGSLMNTIEAMTLLHEESVIAGSNLGEFMENNRVAYFRQVTSEGAEVNTVTIKCMLLLFLMAYTSNEGFRHEKIFKAPDEFFKGKAFLSRGEPHRESMKIMYKDDEVREDDTLPFHPEWFGLDVPLLDSPFYTSVVVTLLRGHAEVPGAYRNKMSFFRVLTVHVNSALKVRLQAVSQAQTKLLALGTSLLWSSMLFCQNGELSSTIRSLEKILGWNATNVTF